MPNKHFLAMVGMLVILFSLLPVSVKATNSESTITFLEDGRVKVYCNMAEDPDGNTVKETVYRPATRFGTVRCVELVYPDGFVSITRWYEDGRVVQTDNKGCTTTTTTNTENADYTVTVVKSEGINNNMLVTRKFNKPTKYGTVEVSELQTEEGTKVYRRYVDGRVYYSDMEKEVNISDSVYELTSSSFPSEEAMKLYALMGTAEIHDSNGNVIAVFKVVDGVVKVKVVSTEVMSTILESKEVDEYSLSNTVDYNVIREVWEQMLAWDAGVRFHFTFHKAFLAGEHTFKDHLITGVLGTFTGIPGVLKNWSGQRLTLKHFNQYFPGWQMKYFNLGLVTLGWEVYQVEIRFAESDNAICVGLKANWALHSLDPEFAHGD